MPSLAHQRCFNHAQREAVARCPECKQFFCRECITEHEDRVVCAACLRRLMHRSATPISAFAWLFHFAQCVLGILIVWYFFFLIGDSLLKLPDSFHAGTIWQVHWLNQE